MRPYHYSTSPKLSGQNGAPIGAGGSRPSGRDARADSAPSVCSVSTAGTAPPTTNRGVQNTEGSDRVSRENVGVLVDWLSFTLPYEGWERSVSALVGEWEERERGMFGYSHSASCCGSGSVCWSPEKQDQGVHVVLPSTALGELAALFPEVKDIRGFMRYVRDLGGVFRRVDWAFDDRMGLLSWDRINQALDREELVMRWQQVDEIKRRVWRRKAAGESAGHTLRFGNRVSDSFLRIYDKRAERIEKGEEDPGPWMRAELEFKGKKAHRLAERFIDEGCEVIAQVFMGLLDFKRPGQDVNKSRWETCGWWVAFLGSARKASAGLPRPERTLARCIAYVSKYWAPTLAFLASAEGGAIDGIEKMISEGARRMQPWQRRLLRTGLALG